jgi:hypothetical protein
MAITPQERAAFLRRQGWKPELPAAERKRIEEKWADDDDIEYALGLGG